MTRIYIGNRYQGKFTCDGRTYTKWQLRKYLIKKTAKNTMLIASAVVIGGWLFTAGVIMAKASIEPQKVWAKETIEVPISTKFEDIPMLVRICKAESGGRQFNKDGNVLRGSVDKSDLGYCQINERYNNDEARRLGYDIYTEKGNKDFAIYLFMNRGTQPWLASMCTANGWGTKAECSR